MSEVCPMCGDVFDAADEPAARHALLVHLANTHPLGDLVDTMAALWRRLAAAETVCVLVGLCARADSTPIGAAALQAWDDWQMWHGQAPSPLPSVGSDEWLARVARLAERRDQTRQREREQRRAAAECAGAA